VTSLRISGLLALGMTVSCGQRSANSADEVQTATQRLQGAWKVASFAPESALEPPLQGLLNAQLGTLQVAFQGDQFSATGPGVNMTGSFKIWSAAFDQLSGTIYDATGVAYRVSGQFEGPAFLFRSYDSPWKGEGKLVR
jgi:hypothetical protein